MNTTPLSIILEISCHGWLVGQSVPLEEYKVIIT